MPVFIRFMSINHRRGEMNMTRIEPYLLEFMYNGLYKPVNKVRIQKRSPLYDVLSVSTLGEIGKIQVYNHKWSNKDQAKIKEYYEIEIVLLLRQHKNIIINRKDDNREQLIKLCIECTGVDPTSMLALFVLARLAEVDKEDNVALGYFRKLAEYHPGVHYFKSRLVTRLIIDKFLDDAIEVIITYKSNLIRSLNLIYIKYLQSHLMLLLLGLVIFLVTLVLGSYKVYWLLILCFVGCGVYLVGKRGKDLPIKLLGIGTVFYSIAYYLFALLFEYLMGKVYR
jgi:hypothetical protein